MPTDKDFANAETDRIERNKNSLGVNDVKVIVNREIDKRGSNKEVYTKIGLVLIPIIIGFFVWLANLNTRVVVIENQAEVNREIRLDIRTIKEEVVNIRERIIRLEENR